MVSAKKRRAGKRLGRASKYCKGKTGRAYQKCRRDYFKKH